MSTQLFIPEREIMFIWGIWRELKLDWNSVMRSEREKRDITWDSTCSTCSRLEFWLCRRVAVLVAKLNFRQIWGKKLNLGQKLYDKVCLETYSVVCNEYPVKCPRTRWILIAQSIDRCSVKTALGPSTSVTFISYKQGPKARAYSNQSKTVNKDSSRGWTEAIQN